MTRFVDRSAYCRLAAAACFVSIAVCSAAEAQALSQRMTGPARFVYNWAGSGPVAAQVMGDVAGAQHLDVLGPAPQPAVIPVQHPFFLAAILEPLVVIRTAITPFDLA